MRGIRTHLRHPVFDLPACTMHRRASDWTMVDHTAAVTCARCRRSVAYASIRRARHMEDLLRHVDPCIGESLRLYALGLLQHVDPRITETLRLYALGLRRPVLVENRIVASGWTAEDAVQ